MSRKKKRTSRKRVGKAIEYDEPKKYINVYYNGEDPQKIEILFMDTPENIIEKIAFIYKTLPQYLYFDKMTFKDGEDVYVEDIKELVEEDVNDFDFENFFKGVQDKWISVKPQELLELWLSFRLAKQVGEGTDDLEERKQWLRVYLSDDILKQIDQQLRWDELNNYPKLLKDKIDKFRNKYEKNLKVKQELEKAKPIKATQFEKSKVTSIIEFERNNMSLSDLFNSIKTNTGIPIAIFKNFYKILKYFKPFDTWSTIEFDEGIILRILYNDNLKRSHESYSLGTIDFDVDKINIRYSIPIKNNVNEITILERIKSIFTIDLDVISARNTKVSGVFYFPQTQFNNYVFADLVMNTPIFSEYLKIDESRKATKRKPGIYVHAFNPFNPSDPITANITQKIREKGDNTMKGKDLKEFPYGKPYIRVKVKASSENNDKVIKFFILILSKLFKIYQEKEKHIIKIYKEYGVNLEVFSKKIVEKEYKIRLKDIDKELFSGKHKYTRRCQPTSRQPIVLDEETRKEFDEARVMEFPKNEEGKHSHILACKSDKFPYPGLMKNTSPYSSLYPYLPCCFTINQTNKENWKNYYGIEGDDDEYKKLAKNKRIIVTNKILNDKTFGVLPNNINFLLEFFFTNSNCIYLRRGVNRTVNSFLECLCIAMDRPCDDIKNFRDSLAIGLPFLSVTKQENFDFSVEEIEEYILSDKYFDPNRFIRLLEEEFKCNIYVFSRDNMNPDGDLKIPKHLENYLVFRTPKYDTSVLIYENMGTEIGAISQCELIVRWCEADASKNAHRFTKEQDNEIYNGMVHIFQKVNKSYSLNKLDIIPDELRDIYGVDIEYQGIDSNGKARLLGIKYDSKEIILFTNPLPPINVESKNYTEILDLAKKTKISYKIAIKFFLHIGGVNEDSPRVPGGVKDNIFQHVINDKCREISCNYFGVCLAIPVENIDYQDVTIDGKEVTIIEQQLIPTDEESFLSIYNKNRRNARYITECFVWIFSKFVEENKIKNLDNNIFEEFVDDKIDIDEDFEYGNIEQIYDLNKSPFSNGKLVLLNDEMLKRLLFLLRTEIVHNLLKVQNFYKNTKILSYYLDITDYKQYPTQVLLRSGENLHKYINFFDTHFDLTKRIDFGNRIPYFFKNLKISKQIFLAQNIEEESLRDAIRLVDIWNKDNYNSKTVDEDSSISSNDLGYTLYAYVNSKKIVKIGHPPPYNDDIKIIGYKLDEDSEVRYVALMNLE